MTSGLQEKIPEANAEVVLADCQKVVLVVDDDDNLRRILVMFLELKGYQVHSAKDGEEALEKIGELHAAGTKIDVILSDIDMPLMNGLDLVVTVEVQACREAGTIVILNTGDDSEERKTQIDKLKTDGKIDGALAKPYEFEKLFELIEQKSVGRGI